MTTREPAPTKAALRRHLLTARGARPAPELTAAGEAIAARLLAQPEIARAGSVAVYVSLDAEPPTRPLLAALHERGVRVLLPVVRDDLDLDWAVYTGPASLAPARMGLLEPTGEPLGMQAVRDVDAVVCPGLAVDHRGLRLGRGGGCYDRVLNRLDDEVWTCVAVYDDEVREAVPASAHDRRVHAAATPTRLLRFRSPVRREGAPTPRPRA